MNLQENLKKTFQSKLILITKEKNVSQKSICKELKLSQSTVSNWYQGKSVPKEDKLKALSDLLNVPVSFWTENNESSLNENNKYYDNDETAIIAEKIRTNNKLKVLFDIAHDSNPEDLQAVYDMLLARKQREDNPEDTQD